MSEEDNSANWKALESNPTAITEYIEGIGFDTTSFVFQDLFSLEDWAQEMILKPCLGLMMIFPITENAEKHRQEEKDQIEEDGQLVDPQLFYMKQYAKNACGTVGVYHILGNLPQEHKALIKPESTLEEFFTECDGKTPHERGLIFKTSKKVKESHSQAVEEGETEVEEEVDNHFVSFVHFNGSLYELDGRKDFPINHGPTNPDSFLGDACKVAQKFMDRDPEQSSFGLVVLAPSAAE